MATDAETRWAIKVSVLALIGEMEEDNAGLDQFVELLAKRQLPITGDTGTILSESCGVYRLPGMQDTTAGSFVAGDVVNVWRSKAVDGATWYFVDNGIDIAGWVHEDWIAVTAGSPASYDFIGDMGTIATGAFYLGNPTKDGSWRIVRSSDNLQLERQESGAWVAKGVFTP